MTRVKEYLRIMWWRHGPGGRGRQTAAIFAHGYHGGYHDGRGEQSPCDEQCARILVDA